MLDDRAVARTAATEVMSTGQGSEEFRGGFHLGQSHQGFGMREKARLRRVCLVW